jgi:hypothetical protein
MTGITWRQLERLIHHAPEAHGMKPPPPREREVVGWDALKQWAPKKRPAPAKA